LQVVPGPGRGDCLRGSEAVYGLAYLGGGVGVLIEAVSEDALEVVALGAEAVGSGVGHVVGGGVERLCARHQSRVCRIETTVHAQQLCSCVAEDDCESVRGV
jgi:hypothetical protein